MPRSYTISALKDVLHYDLETGVFTRKLKTSANVEVDKPAKPTMWKGYRSIYVGGRRYKEHRLAWFYVYGVWPNGEIDHINRDRADNRISNLREADSSQNTCNSKLRADSTTGVKGVSWNVVRRRWDARVVKNGRTYSRMFKTFDDAVIAVHEMRARLHGDFATDGEERRAA